MTAAAGGAAEAAAAKSAPAAAEHLTAGDVAAGEPPINPKPKSKPTAKGKPKARAGGAAPIAGAYKRATSTSAKRLVLFGILAAGSAVALRDFKRGTVPSVRLGVGILFAGIFLSALADVVPEVAGPLGLLILVGAFVLPGPHGEPSVGADLIASVRNLAK